MSPIFVMNLMLTAFLAQPTGATMCLDFDSAKTIARDYAEATYCFFDQEDPRGDRSEPGDREDLMLRCEGARGGAERLYFDDKRALYVATMQLWECAPATQCWQGITIDCLGQIRKFSGGED